VRLTSLIAKTFDLLFQTFSHYLIGTKIRKKAKIDENEGITTKI
jgi:hypothetical protein